MDYFAMIMFSCAVTIINISILILGLYDNLPFHHFVFYLLDLVTVYSFSTL